MPTHSLYVRDVVQPRFMGGRFLVYFEAVPYALRSCLMTWTTNQWLASWCREHRLGRPKVRASTRETVNGLELIAIELQGGLGAETDPRTSGAAAGGETAANSKGVA